MEVMTVLGPIAPEELGVTSVHEHIIADCSFSGNDPQKRFDDVDLMAEEVAHFREEGGRTIVELTTRGLGQDAAALRDISGRSGVQIVAASGFYREIVFPDYVATATVDQLRDIMIKDIRVGIDNTDVRAGVIGELASEFPGETLSENQEKVFRAAGQAAVETGVGITTHCWQGAAASEMIRVLTEEGVDPGRILIGHLAVIHGLMDRIFAIADKGAMLGIDCIGFDMGDFTDHSRAEMVKTLIDRGYISQITIALDMMRTFFLKKFGGNGYGYLINGFVDIMRDHGVSQYQIDTLLIDNPRRLLAGG